MRILHTSDWHLGRKLKEHDRTEEQRKFLSWLEGVIADERPDALIVSGDIFDTLNPPTEAQEMYYTFLAETAGRICRDIIITAGNHDSAPFIDAPAKLAIRNNIHIIGRAREEEIVTLTNELGNLEAVICAVPFLHDRDVRRAKSEATDTEHEIRAGIKSHYARIIEQAREIRADKDIPIIAAGHLFLEAGATMGEEGEHALYVGTAIKVGTDIFPEDVSYVALGHLHSAQKVGRDNIRYSGSPIAMSFGELGAGKSVSIVDFDGRNFAGAREISIPVFQKMVRISGDMAGIERGITELAGNESVWAEVVYTGEESPGNLRDRLDEILPPNVEVLSIVDKRKYAGTVNEFDGKKLEDISPEKMFERLLAARNVADDKRELYMSMYTEILSIVNAGGMAQ